MTSLVLSSAPLSQGYRNRLQEAFGKQMIFMHLAEIRRQRPLEALRHLRAAAAAGCYIAIEDDSSVAVLPILQALASVTWPRKLSLVHKDLTTSRVSHMRVPLAIAATLSATARGAISARAAMSDLKHLGRVPRINVTVARLSRVLYLNSNLWFGLKVGGSVGHVAGVVNAFSRRGLDVRLATAPEPVMIAPSVEVQRLAPPRSLGLPFELNYYSYQRYVVRTLASGTTDLCYQRLSLGSYAGVVLSRRLRVPLAIEWNGSEAWVAKHWGRPLRYEALALAAEEISLKHAHIIVTVSTALRDELVNRGVDPDRIVCHPNGVDPIIFNPERFPPLERAALRGSLQIPANGTVVTFLGTFGRWHGADVLARAIRRLSDTAKDSLASAGVSFLFLGDGLMLSDVKQILNGTAATPFVRFTGIIPQEQAPAYLAASDILVAPHVPNADGTPFFGSPTKLFEYLAMGRAIVASNLDQLGDVLRDGIDVRQIDRHNVNESSTATAILVPPGDDDALARGIRYFVEQPRLRELIGRNARELALRRYTWDHHVSAILERIQLLGSKVR